MMGNYNLDSAICLTLQQVLVGSVLLGENYSSGYLDSTTAT